MKIAIDNEHLNFEIHFDTYDQNEFLFFIHNYY